MKNCSCFLPQFLGAAVIATLSLVGQHVYAQPEAIQAKATQNKGIQGERLDYIVATVDDTPVLKSQLDAAVMSARQGLASLKTPIPDQLETQVLEGLIARNSQMALIKHLGQSINSDMLNEALNNIALKQGVSTLSAFERKLESQQPGSYKKLREQVRQELAITQLRQQELARRVNISKQDIDYFLLSPESQSLFDIEYNTNHFRVSLPAQPTQAQKAEAMTLVAEIKQMLDSGASVESVLASTRAKTELNVQGGNMGFHTKRALPSYLKQDILGLKTGQTTRAIINQDGVHVVQLADIKDKTNQVVRQWQVRHILIKPNEVQSLAQAKHLIDDLYERLRQGDDFAMLAGTYSDDPGSAKKGGSLDWVMRGQMVPEFESEMLRTEIGDFSVPFKSGYGWHILKVEAKRDKNVSDMYRRKIARKALYERRSAQAIEDWMQELRAQSHVRILDPRFAKVAGSGSESIKGESN